MNPVSPAVTTGQMRKSTLCKDIPRAILAAIAHKNSTECDHPSLRKINAEIQRLKALNYMVERGGDYGPSISIEDVEILLKYLPQEE